MTNHWIQEPYPPILVVILAYGDGHSRRRHDLARGTRARRAGQAGNGLGTVAKWIGPMTGVSNVGTAVGKRRTLRTDGSIVVSVLIETASANVAETVMETESGTENTASANEILNGTETDATGIATGTETAIVTVNEVTGTDGTKRIAIERAGRTARSVVGLLSPPRIGVNLLDRVIVLLLLPRTHWASEEDPPTMTYVQPRRLWGSLACIHHVSFVILIDSQTVHPSAALVRRAAAKIAAGGLPTRRKTMNVRETQIGGVEIARKMLAMAARHRQKRCET